MTAIKRVKSEGKKDRAAGIDLPVDTLEKIARLLDDMKKVGAFNKLTEYQIFETDYDGKDLIPKIQARCRKERHNEALRNKNYAPVVKNLRLTKHTAYGLGLLILGAVRMSLDQIDIRERPYWDTKTICEMVKAAGIFLQRGRPTLGKRPKITDAEVYWLVQGELDARDEGKTLLAREVTNGRSGAPSDKTLLTQRAWVILDAPLPRGTLTPDLKAETIAYSPKGYLVYADIGEAIGMPADTVKNKYMNYKRRNPTGEPTTTSEVLLASWRQLQTK